jgi:hypothetical protein
VVTGTVVVVAGADVVVGSVVGVVDVVVVVDAVAVVVVAAIVVVVTGGGVVDLTVVDTSDPPQLVRSRASPKSSDSFRSQRDNIDLSPCNHDHKSRVSPVEEEVTSSSRPRNPLSGRFGSLHARVRDLCLFTMKGEAVPRQGLIWTIVGILLIVALLIYIF